MTTTPSGNYLSGLVTELRKLPDETRWLEFKLNNSDPEGIGEYVSAISNSAALEGKAAGYVVWGVEDRTHDVVGTDFRPSMERKGAEPLENWLLRLLSPRVSFRFHEFLHEGRRIVLLEIPRAPGRPVQFQGIEFVRVGSHRQKLKDYPEIERELWRVFDTTPFEDQIAAEGLDGPAALALLDYPSYFDLLKLPLPSDRAGVLARLAEDRMIVRNDSGGWNVTNLGAILFAKDLDSFRTVSRKAVRVVVYEGRGRLKAIREQVSRRGYAAGFQALIEFINALLPRNEVIGQALREDVPMYPELAIRELVPNALIHQDFSITGAGPMIEIFADRMEVTNPGRPLVSTDRFLDSPPRSRNEALASFMRRIGICEERGGGVDKVVLETEVFQLPAPLFDEPPGSTRAVLFAHKPLRAMDRAERTRACYLHSALRFVQHDPMTNSSLRQRFGIEEHNLATASRIIRDAVEDGLVKPLDPAQAKRYAKYLPWWA
jgi:ATP-dependent DNA helicase RecG